MATPLWFQVVAQLSVSLHTRSHRRSTMKRLFRTSKSGVDIPPHEIPSSPPAPPRKSISSLLMGEKNHVSPFPVNMGQRSIPDSNETHSAQPNGWVHVSPPEQYLPPQPQPFYLPPGAGPPSPQMRPLTPSMLPVPHRASQTSLAEPNHRDRGYSSASASGRDSEPGHIARPRSNGYDTQPHSFTPQPQEDHTHTLVENIQALSVDDHDVKEKKKFWGWGEKKKDNLGEEEDRGRIKVKEVDDVGTAISMLNPGVC